jgi:hypothetical protein
MRACFDFHEYLNIIMEGMEARYDDTLDEHGSEQGSDNG